MTTSPFTGPPSGGRRLLLRVLNIAAFALLLAAFYAENYAPTALAAVLSAAAVVAVATFIVLRTGGPGNQMQRTTSKHDIHTEPTDIDRSRPRLGIFASTLATVAAGICAIAYRLGLHYTGTRRPGLAGAS